MYAPHIFSHSNHSCVKYEMFYNMKGMKIIRGSQVENMIDITTVKIPKLHCPKYNQYIGYSRNKGYV